MRNGNSRRHSIKWKYMQSVQRGDEHMDQSNQHPQAGQTQETQVGGDSLAQIDAKGTTILFGVVPMVAIAALILIGTVMYMIRKKRTEADLTAAMTMDDGDGAKETDT